MDRVSIFDEAARADPYPLYAQLRKASPVYLEPDFDTYVLTRFDDVYDALRDHSTYSSAQGIAPGLRGSGGMMTTTLITTDPPRHTRLRSLVNRAFTPRVLGTLEPWLVDVVDELLADMPTDDVDIVEKLTVPLPVTAIARLLGVAAGDRDRFKRWSDAVVGVTDRGIENDAREQLAEMMQYFASEIAARKEAPLHDLLTTIVEAEIDGERLTDLEMLGFCLLLLVAGNETTTNLLSNLLHVLAGRPDLWQALRNDRSLVPGAIEEALRYDSPVQGLWRTTTRPVTLRDVPIPEGSRVMVCYAAANRDPDEFPDPEEFRLDRNLDLHVAFGYGIHYCLGAPLARLESKVALNALLDRYDELALGRTRGERLPTSILRGFKKLNLRLDPSITTKALAESEQK